MSSLTRALTGPDLTFHLAAQIEDLRRDESYERTGRAGRTLVKDGPLRLTLTVLGPGIDVGTENAEGPISLQVLTGRLRYRAESGEEAEIDAGELLFFGPGHARDLIALEETALLLTVTPGDEDEGIARQL
ncbi:MAG TPA: hypothetical protein VFQ22_02950 [Longimicrobiales bacterium]|nr:hypothetical protein [Longimicrobiales bacterium]